METNAALKAIVQQKYATIAETDPNVNKASCCGAGGVSDMACNIMTDDYRGTAGYDEGADLGLGCGLPVAFARIRKGDTVIDLGSGAGNDCFIARHEVGEEGHVIGIDFTEAMVVKAAGNARRLGYTNVEFRQGDIEHMPVEASSADVIISNCVLNLVPDKAAVFAGIFKALKPGGHFSISDIVLTRELPGQLQKDAEMYAGCVAGAIQKTQYLELIKIAGFENIEIQKEKPIILPADILQTYDLGSADMHDGIVSITVYAEKPAAPDNCCGAECCN